MLIANEAPATAPTEIADDGSFVCDPPEKKSELDFLLEAEREKVHAGDLLLEADLKELCTEKARDIVEAKADANAKTTFGKLIIRGDHLNSEFQSVSRPTSMPHFQRN